MAGQIVEFESNGSTARGYLSPAASGSGPGVIVIQEWWGLVDHIQEVADRFAAAGFTALAPDLYRGESTADPDDAGRLMMALDIGRAVSDLEGAVDCLLAHDACSSSTLGAVGFCMGGQLALAIGCKTPKVGAVVDFYGVHPNVTLDFSGLRAPVLGLFGEKDGFVTPEVARKLQHDVTSAGKSMEIKIYPGSDHAFVNDSREDAYDAEAAGDAWTLTRRFFEDNL
jgi:carboxymethylenebutenolidase